MKKEENNNELLWDIKGSQVINKSHTQRIKIEYQELSLTDEKFGIELQKSFDTGYEKEKFIHDLSENLLLYFSDDEVDALLEALKKDREKRK